MVTDFLHDEYLIERKKIVDMMVEEQKKDDRCFFERHRDTLSFLAVMGILWAIIILSILKICRII